MFPILVTQFYGNLSIAETPAQSTPNSFSYMSGLEILRLNFRKI